MARVKLKFPTQQSLFTTKIPVRITDLNYGNHLGNDALLSLVHEARVRMLQQWQYTELDIGGCGLIMADMMVAYKSEGRYGDLLHITIYADEISQLSFDLLYKIKAESNGTTRVLAEVKTGMVCYDYTASGVCNMPESFASKISGSGALPPEV